MAAGSAAASGRSAIGASVPSKSRSSASCRPRSRATMASRRVSAEGSAATAC
jgi:hypothetical protein